MQLSLATNAQDSALMLAAQAVAQAPGATATLFDIVRSHAVQHYAAGLYQFIELRVASSDLSTVLMQDLQAWAANEQGMQAQAVVTSPDDSEIQVSIQAQLYHQARQLCIASRKDAQSTTTLYEDMAGPEISLPSHAQALIRLRDALSFDEFEAFELYVIRELDLDDIAYVLDAPPLVIEQRLACSMRHAWTLVHNESHAIDQEQLRKHWLSEFAQLIPKTAKKQASSQPPQPPDPLSAGSVLGKRYEIAEHVGSGTFADVYRANDIEVPGHVVALKLLHQPSLSEKARNTALRELRHIASVMHPSVVQFKDNGWHQNRLWFVMPWYEGETLEARIQRAPLTREEARRIFQPLARALAVMHKAGLRHQDIKPDNIFLARVQALRDAEHAHNAEIFPILLDLGVAAKEAERLIAGTPTYFAPEVAARFASIATDRETSAKADVFALALALRNALDPETQDTVHAGAIRNFIERRATHVPAAPKTRDLAYLRPHFRRWLNVDPDVRPQAEELAKELRILTLPEEKRKRRRAWIRGVTPFIIAGGVVFSAVAYELHMRAERQELEAQRARVAEANVRADLQVSDERRRALERDYQEMEGRYARSRMSRAELDHQLTRVEKDRNFLARELETNEKRRRSLQQQIQSTQISLENARSEIAQINQALENTMLQLRNEQSQNQRLKRSIQQARNDIDRAKRKSAEEQARIAELEQSVRQHQRQRDQLEDKNRDLRQDKQRLEKERDALKSQLRTLKAVPSSNDKTPAPADAETLTPNRVP